MPFPIELVWATALLYVFYLMMTIPLGSLLLRWIYPSLPPQLQLLSSFGISIAVLSGEVSLLAAANFSPMTIRTTLAATVFFAFAGWVTTSECRALLNRRSAKPLALLGAYLLLTVSTAAYPAANIRDISPDAVDRLTGLPIDNMLPYNFSRYLLSDINPNRIDVVPGWRAGERGPVGGLISAATFYVFGIEERNGWLEVTPGYYFIYHTLLSFLNLLSLFAAYCIAQKHFGSRAALLCCIMAMTSYFYFVNALFSWPKLLSAYYILTALLLSEMTSKRSKLLVGGFLALGPLSHDSALFSTIAYFALLTTLSLWQHRNLRNLISTLSLPLVGFFVTYLPWLLFKTVYTKPSPRLLYMHLFCDTREGIEGTPFSSYLEAYLAKYSWLEIVGIKLQNLWYPFDVTALFDRISLYWHSPLTLINFIASDTFLRFLYSVGIPLFLIFLLSLWRLRREPGYRPLLIYLAVGFGTLPFVAAISGCSNNTVNHIWAYPAFLAVAVAIGAVVERSGPLLNLIFAVGCALNSVVAVIYIHLHSHLRPFIHGSSGYFLTQATAVLTLFLLSGYLYLAADDSEERADG